MRYLPWTGKVLSLQVISAYTLIGSVWIIISNQLLTLMVHDISTLTRLITASNLIFVVFTAWIMRRLGLQVQQDCVQQSSAADWALGEYPHGQANGLQSNDQHLQCPEDLEDLASRDRVNPNKLLLENLAKTSNGASATPVDAIQVEDLKRAIAQQEFVLHYQPIVFLNSNRTVGFEALVRWQHPEKGLIMPGDFIPLAESSGLILPLGAWVLEEACQQMVTWRQQFPEMPSLMISVNLSIKQFNQPDLVTQIAAVLEKTGLPPQYLKLEITETAIMQDAEAAIAMLTKLHQMGVKLSIDDFGTGYSSLSYLYYFPVDSLKVDRSFISRIDQDGEQVELVRTVLTLAWNLGLDTIAEGIETYTQLSQLKALQCEYGQGYFFNQSLPAEKIQTLLQDQLEHQA
jgi:EAL domain-containing protein (putative c-di-GMP-specific phosphodiesterase class I)